MVFVGDDNRALQRSSFRNIQLGEADVAPRAVETLFVQQFEGSPYLYWFDNSSNELGFRVERSLSGANNFSAYASVTSNEERVLLDHDPRLYDYRVVSFNDEGEMSSASIVGEYEVEVNEVAYAIESFDSNQDFGSYSLSNGELTLEGNSWKAVRFPYTLTEVSVLTFEYKSEVEGRVQGIGLDDNDRADQNHVFQLSGTANYGFQEFRNYSGSDWVSYSIPVGEFITGDISYLVFVGDDNRALQRSSFRNIQVVEASVPPSSPDRLFVQQQDGSLYLNWFDNSSNETSFRVERSSIGLDDFEEIGNTGVNENNFLLDHDPSSYTYRVFAVNMQGESVSPEVIGEYQIEVNEVDYSIESFDSNQDFGSYSLSNGELTLEGNAWKAVNLNYTVTEVSTLSFDFKVNTLGRIQGIGLDNNNRADQNHVFQLAGSGTYGIQDYRNYDGEDWISYSIPIGQFIQEEVNYLVFVGDDNSSVQSSSFRNVRIEEASVAPAAPSNAFIQQSEGQLFLNWFDNSSNELGFRVERAERSTSNFSTYGSVGVNDKMILLDHDPALYNYRIISFNNIGESVSTEIGGDYQIELFGTKYSIESFDPNQDFGGYSLENKEITLIGNSWKKISFPYSVVENTILSFEFKSTVQGRIQGIGLETNNRADQNHIFQLYGTANYGFQDYRNYTGNDWVQYYLFVGNQISGDISSLVFVGDDNNGLQRSSFRNISIENATVVTDGGQLITIEGKLIKIQ